MCYFPAILTEEQTGTFYNRIQTEFEWNGWGLYAVELRSNGTFIGYVGLHEIGFDTEVVNLLTYKRIEIKSVQASYIFYVCKWLTYCDLIHYKPHLPTFSSPQLDCRKLTTETHCKDSDKSPIIKVISKF